MKLFFERSLVVKKVAGHWCFQQGKVLDLDSKDKNPTGRLEVDQKKRRPSEIQTAAYLTPKNQFFTGKGFSSAVAPFYFFTENQIQN